MDGNKQMNTNGFIPNEIPVNNPYDHNPYQTDENRDGNTDRSNMDGPMTQAYNPSGSGNGSIPLPQIPQGNKNGPAVKIIAGVVCAFVVILAIAVGIAGYLRSRPSYKIAKGFQNLGREISQTKNPLLEKIGYEQLLSMMRKEGGHVDSSLDFSIEIPMLGSTTLGIDTDFYKDMQAKELNADTSLSMMNYDFAHLDIYADEDVFCFSIPELFMEDLYINNENVVSQFNQSVLADNGYTDDMEDFSIDLFSGEDERTALDILRDYEAVYERFEDDLNACKEGMKIEKAGKHLYRMTFPAKETNRLFKNFAQSYGDVYGMEEDMDLFLEYDEVISEDVSLLFEISGRNRIESIMIENPVAMLDGNLMVEAEIFFIGEERSTDKIQGKISASADDNGEREILWQIQQTGLEHVYQFDMDIKLSEDGNTVGKMKLTADCNAQQDQFDAAFVMEDEDTDMEITVEGNIDDIIKGEKLNVSLDHVIFSMDDEELFRITGDVLVEPLKDEVKRTVDAKTAFFEMTYEDWFAIIEQIDDAYGSILDYLW